MKSRITVTILSAIITIAMLPIFAVSRNNNLLPNATASFFIFSLPQNMAAIVNSTASETSPAVSPTNLSLYLSSDRPGGQGAGDIWVSQRATPTSAWGPPQNLGSVVNSSSGDNSPAFTLDGRTMFFNSNRTGMGGQDIYMSTRTDPNNDFGWTAPVNLGVVINTPDAEACGSYFEDPTNGTVTLFFASDRDGGLGDLDIYQSTRNADGTFNAPTNVTQLNSTGRDVRPWIRRDGLEIFLASGRTPSVGSVDIWVSTRSSTLAHWNPPVNVTSLNYDGNDEAPAVSPDGSILYFSSGRDGGIGGTDLYAATRVSINRTPTADFDGDVRTDIGVFRPSDGTWHILQSGSSTHRSQAFGLSGDKIVPGDYDGDGRTDFAVFRPSNGVWYYLRSSDGSFQFQQFGASGDVPAPGDYDGDGKTDFAVYRNGVWYIKQSSNGIVTSSTWGLSSDIPISAASSQ